MESHVGIMFLVCVAIIVFGGCGKCDAISKARLGGKRQTEPIHVMGRIYRESDDNGLQDTEYEIGNTDDSSENDYFVTGSFRKYRKSSKPPQWFW